MKRFFKLYLLSGLSCLLLIACEQKMPPESKPEEAQKAMEAAHGEASDPHKKMMGHGGQQEMGADPHQMGEGMGMAKTPKQVVVPAAVKGKWQTVSILVTDKQRGKAVSYEVAPNSEFEVPDTSLKLIVGAFLPDFSMGGGAFTSASEIPNNPALQVSIKEHGEEKYKGWLFSKFTDMHAFEHEKYSVILEDKFGAE